MTENVPVTWEEQMRADAKAQLEHERPTLGIMSLKGGIMSVGDSAVPGNEIDCIVLASVSENAWYKERYNPDVKSNPTCYALGEGKSDTLKPYDESPEKQSDVCIDCEKFEWGSDPGGGRGKACKERRRLALIPANGSAEMVLLSIPPTSLKNWSNYVTSVIAATSLSTAGVITKIKVVPDAKNQFMVKFEMLDRVSDHVMPQLMAKKGEATALMLRPYPPEEEQEQKTTKKRKF